MNLIDYLAEIEHAVTMVIAEIHADHDHLTHLRHELTMLRAATDDGYRRAEFLALNPDLDDEGLGTAIHWDTYFGPDKERHHKAEAVDATEAKIAARSFSVAALSGNLLQYARQGLSLRYGRNRDGCPVGRELVGLPVHEIIWQGRNQALHWEEGSPHPPVMRCFEELAANATATFSEYKNRSMAYEVVNLLGWRTVEDFNRDMQLYA
ncbi:MAG TPA: hypothetical protein PKM59_14625 [Thermodesulfobacteriota bacterium]|jgi:hypothetical protein|nr:hypothetical protein [Thermodesulfobacteriota bacterium]